MKWDDFFIVVAMPFVIIMIAIMLLLQTGCAHNTAKFKCKCDCNGTSTLECSAFEHTLELGGT